MPDTPEPPYRPSWVDRLIAQIDRLPFPKWIFYVALYVVGSLMQHATMWLDGVIPVGELDRAWLANTVWVALPLGWIHYLGRLARRGLDRFAPVVADRPIEYADARYRMLTMPARPVLIMTAVVGAVLAVGIASDATIQHPASYALGFPVMMLAFGLIPVLVYFTARLLQSVKSIYALVDSVPLLHQRPLFALSNLTMQAGLLWVLVSNANLASAIFLEDASTGSDWAIVGSFSVIATIAAFALFLVPLRGVHHRLEDAKTDLMDENATVIEDTRAKLYRAIAEDRLEDAARIDGVTSGLLRTRDELKAIPTWPWRPGTLRRFSSVVVTPMLLWAIQQVLADRL